MNFIGGNYNTQQFQVSKIEVQFYSIQTLHIII